MQKKTYINKKGKEFAVSDFCSRVTPVGRILEEKDWYIWCCSPIYGEDGKPHVFFSRWPEFSTFDGWLTHSEIAHAVADKPEGPYTVLGTVLKGRGGSHFDGMTVHNPTVHKVGNEYAMFYSGTVDEKSSNQRLGLAMASTLDGPWERVTVERPILEISADKNDWDSVMMNNPALLLHPNGQYWLYYKSWDDRCKLRKVGLAIAENIRGPYIKYQGNPIIDFEAMGSQVEDPYVFMENGLFHMISRDMGVISDRMGMYQYSTDGIRWSEPMLGYRTNADYFGEELQRFERPQILMKSGKPKYLFTGLKGGKYGTSTGAVLKINPNKPCMKRKFSVSKKTE